MSPMTGALLCRLAVAMAVAGVAACGGSQPASYGPNKVEIPVPPPRPATPGATTALESPPPPGAPKESPYPPVARGQLSNGMGVAVVTSRTLPIVQIRVLVRAGSGYGRSPAVATLTGDMLKDGGTRAMSSAELIRRVETLGADLGVGTGSDSTVLSMAVTRDKLDEALSLISQVVREPRFDADELGKLKARATDHAQDLARSSGAWTATRLVFRELFPEKSPYATYGMLPSEIAKVDRAAIRDFYRRFYVPRATTLVLAGDVDEATASVLAERHFGSWTGGAAPEITRAAPKLPARTRVVVAHRPQSVQSDVFVAMLAPPRLSEVWPHVRVANQILGGGVASRLFTDVREQRALAYRTSAQILELAHGEQPLVVYAGTQTGKTTQAVVGLLENLRGMLSAPPAPAETETARRYLSDAFALRMETIGAIADMVVDQDTVGLPDGYWDAYRKRLLATDPAAAKAAAEQLYTPERALVVVAGDADVVAPELTRFGDVVVVDPEKEFSVVRTLPHRGESP